MAAPPAPDPGAAYTELYKDKQIETSSEGDWGNFNALLSNFPVNKNTCEGEELGGLGVSPEHGSEPPTPCPAFIN